MASALLNKRACGGPTAVLGDVMDASVSTLVGGAAKAASAIEPTSLGRFSLFQDARGELFARRDGESVELIVRFDPEHHQLGAEARLDVVLSPFNTNSKEVVPRRAKQVQNIPIDGNQIVLTVPAKELTQLATFEGAAPADLFVTMRISHWVGPNAMIELSGITHTDANEGAGHRLAAEMFL
jgi:hypothetical protein